MTKRMTFNLPTNEDRAAWAAQIFEIEPFNDYPDGSDEATTDVIADLMHYCDQNGINFETCLTMAHIHHQEEVEEENLK